MLRRRVLAGAGIGLSIPLAGCFQDAGDSETADGDEANDETDAPVGPVDDEPDDPSIDGRLRNETDEPQTFAFTLLDEDGTVRSEGDDTVPPDTSVPVPGFGRFETARTIEIAVGESEAAETLEFDVGSLRETRDGTVVIAYTETERLELAFVPREGLGAGSERVIERPRVDEPPYEIDRPEGRADDYLGDRMPTEPSLEFERLAVPRGVLRTDGLTGIAGEAYWTGVLRSEGDVAEAFDRSAVDEETRSRLEAVDFDERVLVAVETGAGSGSVDHRWARVEAVDDGFHLHGYYTDPAERTDDLTTWVSVLAVERPADGAGLARVGLTVDETRRVRFNSTEGVVVLDS